jgi:two-component system, LuxR family, sensor kinase FixL
MGRVLPRKGRSGERQHRLDGAPQAYASGPIGTAGAPPRELEEALAYYRDLYDRAPVGYLLMDAQGVIADINRTGAAMLDWPRERLVGGPFGRWVLRDDRELFARHIGELQACAGRLTQELRIKTRSGWPVPIRLHSARVANGDDGTCAYRTAMVDVSARRFAERQARLQRNRLTHAARLSSGDGD